MSGFKKSERLHHRKIIQELFTEGSSFYLYPFRVKFLASSESKHQVLFSVPKRNFKKAVDRNRIKRLLKESYRSHKSLISELNPKMNIVIVFVGKEKPGFDFVDKKLILGLERLAHDAKSLQHE